MELLESWSLNKELWHLRQQLEAGGEEEQGLNVVEEPVDSMQAFQELEQSLEDQGTWKALVRYLFSIFLFLIF